MKKRNGSVIRCLSLLICTVVLLSQTALLIPASAASIDLPTIIVDAVTKRADVSPYTLGSNHRHAYGGFGMFDTENQQVYPDFLEKTKEANLGVIRYPGGTIANLFTWKDTVGPLEERKNVVLGSSYASVFPYYGLDEHMQYTEAIGAEVIYMVGEAAETPEGAADLVEYLNGIPGENKNGGTDWAQKRADNGHPEPYNVTYFEIGNEMYLDNQQYWLNYPSAVGNTDRASRYMQGDTVSVTKSVARKYGTWTENTSDGSSGQAFYTQYNPAVAGTDKVYVDGVQWTRVDSLENASSDANVYTFEGVTGKITFGDGTNGAIPAKNARITVDYHHKHAGFTQYYDAMKAVDPDIKIFANLPWAFNFVEGTKCDGIVYHNYFTYSADLKDAEALHDAYMKMADDLVKSIDNNVSQLRERTKRQDTIAAVTEFGSINNAVIYSTDKSDYGRDEARSLSRALSFAVTYMGSAKAESLIHIHQAFTAYSFGGGEKLPNADFVYNSMYAPTKEDPSIFIEGGTALAYKVIGNNVASSYRNSYVQSNPLAGNKMRYDALTTSVTVDEETGELYLMVVNRHPEKDITAMINLGGYTIQGDSRIQILNAEDITSCNTPDDPNAITISEYTDSFGVGESSFSFEFPAHSLVAIKLSGSFSSPYSTDVSEDFENTEGTLPDFISATGNASVQTVNGEKVLSLTRSGSNVTVKLPLTEKGDTASGISKIKLRINAQQTTNARLQVMLNTGKTETLMFAMEGGFVKNDAKIRAVYTKDSFHEFEIAVDHKSGQYVLYFDGSYIGSPGKFSPNTDGSPELVISAMTANGTFLIDDYSVETASTDNVRTVVGVSSSSVTTSIGVSPVLPDKVTVTFNTGETEDRSVVWEAVSAEDLAKEGKLTVKGHVDNIAIPCLAQITVINENPSDPESDPLPLPEQGQQGQQGQQENDKPMTALYVGIGIAVAAVTVGVIVAVITVKKKKTKA